MTFGMQESADNNLLIILSLDYLGKKIMGKSILHYLGYISEYLWCV